MATLILNSHGFNTRQGVAQIKGKLDELGIDTNDMTIFAVLYPDYEIDEKVTDNLTNAFGFKQDNIYLSANGIPEGITPDIVYVTEGNTFEILSYMRGSGLYSYIKELCTENPDTIYIGSSAGAMIAGSDVFLAQDFDSFFEVAFDFRSLGLFDGTIIPHCTAGALENYISMKEDHILARYDNIYSVSDEEVLVIKDGKVLKEAVVTNFDRSKMRVSAVRFFGPSTEKELLELEFYVDDEVLQCFYRLTAGCVVVNSLGEVDIYSIKAMLSGIDKKNYSFGLIHIGFIKNKGYLYINHQGNIFLYENKQSTAARQKWENIEELLEINFMG